jgi:hypothetical protein
MDATLRWLSRGAERGQLCLRGFADGHSLFVAADGHLLQDPEVAGVLEYQSALGTQRTGPGVVATRYWKLPVRTKGAQKNGWE